MIEKDKWTIRDELYMFLELCAGVASIQKELGGHWKNWIFVNSPFNMFHVPIVPDDLDVIEWYSVPETAPISGPIMQMESIDLNELAWRWPTTPQGQRLYTIKAGLGPKTSTIAYSDPRMHLWNRFYNNWDYFETPNDK